MLEIDVRMPLDRTAPALARHALDGLSGQVRPEDLDRFQVAVSELVTNAIVHGPPSGEGSVHLGVEISTHRLRVSVDHEGSFEATSRTPQPDQDSGWGLFLLDRLADRWGVEGHDGTLIWAEFELAQGA